MKNIVVIYWSGTGNTEAISGAVAEGAKIEGTVVTLLNVSEAKMEPFDEAITKAVKGKNLGSYGLGIFLGYAVDDVAYFIDCPNEKCKMVGYWNRLSKGSFSR